MLEMVPHIVGVRQRVTPNTTQDKNTWTLDRIGLAPDLGYMDTRGIFLFLHLIGLAIWFGATLVLALLTIRAKRTDNWSVISFAYNANSQILKGPVLVGMLLNIVSGFGLTAIGGFGYFQPTPNHWLFQMQLLGIVAFALALLVQIPNARCLAQAAEAIASTGEESESFQQFKKLKKRNALVSSFNGLILLLVTLLGALRPG